MNGLYTFKNESPDFGNHMKALCSFAYADPLGLAEAKIISCFAGIIRAYPIWHLQSLNKGLNSIRIFP